MKFKEYLEKLELLAENHPEALECEVIYAKDDEGNGYQKVICSPALSVIESLDEYYLEECALLEEGGVPNAVCVN